MRPPGGCIGLSNSQRQYGVWLRADHLLLGTAPAVDGGHKEIVGAGRENACNRRYAWAMDSKRQRGRPPSSDVLTPAEWRVAEAVRHGLTNRQIAERQGVSLDAVKFHVANILVKLSLPGRSALHHWEGVRLDSCITGGRHQMDEPVGIGRIGQIARTVRDIETARKWYGEVLGLRHLYSFGNITFFDCDGTRLFLSEGEGASNSIIYFQVSNVHDAHAALAERGVEFMNAPHMIHRHDNGVEEWMAFFKDVDGQPLAIIAQIGPET